MKLLAVVFLVAAGCGDNQMPADDGFGGACTVNLEDNELLSPCMSLLGEGGVCEQITTGDPAGICRRWCRGDETSPGACPDDQLAVPIVAGRCLCRPRTRRSQRSPAPARRHAVEARRKAARARRSPGWWRYAW